MNPASQTLFRYKVDDIISARESGYPDQIRALISFFDFVLSHLGDESSQKDFEQRLTYFLENNNNVTEMVWDIFFEVHKILHEVKNYSNEYVSQKLEMYAIGIEPYIAADLEVSARLSDKVQSGELHELVMSLNESSNLLIADESKINSMQEYLHIKRSVEDDLIETVRSSKMQKGATLVLLCGNVGDGKSHLLAYTKKQNPEVFNDITIINDATESSGPNKTSLETLREKLAPYKDVNLESESRTILGINFGVLSNFINNEKVRAEFGLFCTFIDSLDLKQKLNSSNPNFKFINIGLYDFIEFRDGDISSPQIDAILTKIVEKDKDSNPFYRAYLKDINDSKKDISLLNYEILSLIQTREAIRKYLIRIVVEFNSFLSMRSILSIISRIILGERNVNKVDSLLYNNLFSSSNEDKITSYLQKLDPINDRDDYYDNILIEISQEDDFKRFLSKHSTLKDEVIEKIVELLSLEKNETTKNETIIRLLAVNPKQGSLRHSNSLYKDFVKYLDGYVSFIPRLNKEMYKLVEQTMYLWNGYHDQKYVFINDTQSNIRLLQYIDIENDRKLRLGKSVFSRTFVIEYSLNGSSFKFEVDFEFFKLMKKVTSGYICNKLDRERAQNFEVFLGAILKSDKYADQIFLYDKETEKCIRLDFDPYTDDFVLGEK